MPAPIGGLNARDSIAAMRPQDAIKLDNWFPQATSVDLRKGFTSFATFNGVAESVFAYTATSADVFVGVRAAGTYSLYDASAGGALSTAVVGGAAVTLQALTSCRFDTVNVGTTGGQFLLACNGEDPMIRFDGTTWTVATGITGITNGSESIASIALYGERVWLMEKDTFDVWYLPVASVAGAVTRLNLGSLFKLGGSLQCLVTWSADSSSDVADYIGFVSTEGEVLVYTGTDPADPALWARVGHFRLGRPVTRGNRCWAKLGADAVILTTDGLVPLAKAAMLGRDRDEWSVSDKIRTLFNRDIQTHGARFGWAVTVHPSGNKLIVNVPTSELTTSYQYVMNTQTRAWCRFTGWNAFCFEVTKDVLYFGGSGVLVKADTGLSDGGAAIGFDAQQAFSYFGKRGQQKQFTMMRPILELDGPIQLQIGLNTDYGAQSPDSTVAVDSAGGDPWEVSWSAAWGGAMTVYRGWLAVRALGYAAAPRLKGSADEVQLSWSATDLVFMPGNIL